MLSDYVFFGKAFHWSPGDIDALPWSRRKRIKDAYMEHMQNNGN